MMLPTSSTPRSGDQSGNSADATRRNAAAEGVADRVELHTADMRSLPFESFGMRASSPRPPAFARQHCPRDIDLLLLQGIILRETSAFPEVEGCLIAVLSGQWLAASKKQAQCRREARHQLALLYVATARFAEAEALANGPVFHPVADG
jgi:hypothetical protein